MTNFFNKNFRIAPVSIEGIQRVSGSFKPDACSEDNEKTFLELKGMVDGVYEENKSTFTKITEVFLPFAVLAAVGYAAFQGGKYYYPYHDVIEADEVVVRERIGL